tara:strand:- start:941 stop:1339 length:399 start_codon:yes stop_codon:yes gene_type:complete
MFNTHNHNDLTETVKKAKEFGKIQLQPEKESNKLVELPENMSLENYLKLRKNVQQGQPIEVEEPLKGKGYPYNEDEQFEKDMERIEKMKQDAQDERDRRKEVKDSRKERENLTKKRRAAAALVAKKIANRDK